ncbi:flagellar hook-basal body complex protein [Virgibacillus oceani]|uniref:Flagellar hook protein FlgE n=1 Tax=Virgibacillus oceani TaxID=1479511 RepID=A0A917H669_9BACI|nr:flagellar hook-basal body complex protein [Virgibacillus oceani]GGG68983.1 flagellar hook protein FlgE [Virgibacillus oceani]
MLRSMYAGISGMKGFQTKLDVIGNNIANVNTVGFKKGRVTFQDMMSQMTRGAQGATASRGGVNPMQVGLGSQLGSIDNIHTQGFRQTTNNPLDFALEGDGMFVVASELGPGNTLGGANVAYTRAGNFYLDEAGNIVNPQGLYLMGFPAFETGQNIVVTDDENDVKINITLDNNNNILAATDKDGADISDNIAYNGGIFTIEDDSGNIIAEITQDTNGKMTAVNGSNEPIELISEATVDYNTNPNIASTLTIPESAQSFSIQANGIVNYIDEFGTVRVAGKIAIANFSNPAGLQKAGSNLYLNSENAGYTGLVEPETDGTASIVSGALEMSNVDLAEEFTEMITAQRGFQANTRIITTSDEILQELVNLKR